MRLRVAFLLLVSLIFAVFASAQTVKWRTVAEGTNSKITKFMFRQVQTDGDWQQLWKSIGDRGRAPSVDFAKQEMVILNLDTEKQGGTSVYIETMTFEAGQLMVKAVRKQVRDAPRGTSNPWVAVALDRIGGHLKLSMRDIQGYPTFSMGNCRCAKPCLLTRCSCSCHQMNHFPYPLDWEVEYDDSRSPSPISGAFVISSSAELNNYWTQVFGMVKEEDQPDRPRMNFSEESLVAIHLGPRPTGGYSIGVFSLEIINPTETTLKYWENTPGIRDNVTQALTAPYAWLRIPRVTSRVTVLKMPGRPLGR